VNSTLASRLPMTISATVSWPSWPGTGVSMRLQSKAQPNACGCVNAVR
jgi:hypothetical protein